MGDFDEILARAAFALCTIAWGVAILRALRGQPLLTQEARRPAAWGLLDVFVAFALLQCAPLAGAVVAWILPHVVDTSASASFVEAAIKLANSLAALIAMAVSVLFVMLRTGAGLRDLGMDLRHALRDVQLGLIALLMIGPIVYTIQAVLVKYWFPSEHPLLTDLQKHPDAATIASVIVAAVVAAPMVEEFLFRVMLQGWMQRVATLRGGIASWITGEPVPDPQHNVETFSDATHNSSPALGVEGTSNPIDQSEVQPSFFARWLPIVGSAAVFGLVHINHGPDPIPLFVFALALGYLYQRTGRILPCLTLHFLLNGVSLVMLMIEMYGQSA